MRGIGKLKRRIWGYFQFCTRHVKWQRLHFAHCMAAADSALAGAGVEGAPPSQAKPGPAPSAPAPSSSDTCAYFEPAIGPAGDAAALRRLFSAWGGVARVDLPRYLHSSQVKGYAFLHFEKASDMEAACRAFEGGMPSTCPTLPLPRQQEWREVEQSVQEGALPALRLIPRATWAQYKAVWSSTQARARAEAVGQPPIHRCLVRVFGLPATGVRYAELRQRLAELAPVAYLDFPHAVDAPARAVYPPLGSVPAGAPTASDSTPVPQIPPGQAIVRFSSASGAAFALRASQAVHLLLHGRRLHLFRIQGGEAQAYARTVAGRQAASSALHHGKRGRDREGSARPTTPPPSKRPARKRSRSPQSQGGDEA